MNICFAFVSTNAVLVRKRRRTFGTHKPKAPLCKGSWRRRRLRDCFTMNFLFLQSLRLACASHLPLHKGGLSPPDSTPKRCNTLYLAEQGVWKGVRTNRPYSFCVSAGKPALWKAPLLVCFFWLGNRDFFGALRLRLAYARYPRALQPFTERLQFAIRQTALVRIP